MCVRGAVCAATSSLRISFVLFLAAGDNASAYTTMFAVHGTPTFLDRAERIAYNALPATCKLPRVRVNACFVRISL